VSLRGRRSLPWQSPKSGKTPAISYNLCLNPLGIATVGFAHLAMTQYTAVPLNYNFLQYITQKKNRKEFYFWGLLRLQPS
jgi:hypothetical protein